jgi:ParB-like chromosome segregation protein Spo0J
VIQPEGQGNLPLFSRKIIMSQTKPIADIIVGKRFRQDLGDLVPLAESIRKIGLLHPIGVTQENELIFGERRLRAAQSLGWTEIAATVVDLPSIAAGSYHENAMRKDFTISERVAIEETISRRSPGQPRKNSEEIPNTFMTREKSAKLAGLGNPTTAREAKVIVNQGIPALVEAVDRKEIAIEPGFAIALQSKERQAEIIKLPVLERRAAVHKLERPGKRLGGSRKKVSTRAVATTVRPTMTPPPTKEELGYPPDGSSVAEYDAYFAKYGRTPLRPMVIADLLKDRLSTTELALALLSIADDHHPDADGFFESLDRMLAWVPQPDKTNGMQMNFASDGRKTLAMLEKALPKALALLLALDAKLKEGQQKPFPVRVYGAGVSMPS